MQKNTAKKLKISKKTVATLNRSEMNAAKGGNTQQQTCVSYQSALNRCPSVNGYNCGVGTGSLASKSGFRCCN
jgi:hypothetical protein